MSPPRTDETPDEPREGGSEETREASEGREARQDDETCKFVSQFDGVARCQDPVSDMGFCAFHREALNRGDIDADGVLSDGCSDQRRRREITYHGIGERIRPVPEP